MARYLLDSDAVIDFLANIPSTVELVRGLFGRGDTLSTCDVVLAEVYAGLHASEQDRAEELLSALEFLAISPTAARHAGRWRYAYMRQGRTLSVTDCLIAAVAASQAATVVTGNVRDFPMPEVTVLPLPRVRRGEAC